jgi:hypothetical protein
MAVRGLGRNQRLARIPLHPDLRGACFRGRRITGVILKRHGMRPAVTECEQSPFTPLSVPYPLLDHVHSTDNPCAKGA